MPTDPREPERDAAERARLESLLTRLSDAQLARSLDDGWTIGAVLGHLAFWDRRAAFLVGRWQREQRGPVRTEDIGDVHVVNEALLPTWRALEPRAAADEALAAAEAADRALASASPELIEQVVSAGFAIDPVRAHHRQEHLDEIERALSRAS